MSQELHIGDKLSLIPETFSLTIDEKVAKRALTCKVVYIHPKKRFFTVEYENGVKESFFFSKLED